MLMMLPNTYKTKLSLQEAEFVQVCKTMNTFRLTFESHYLSVQHHTTEEKSNIILTACSSDVESLAGLESAGRGKQTTNKCLNSSS